MDKLTEMQMKLKDVPCPRCYHSALRVTVRPGDSDRSSTYVAECGNCGFTFEVDEERPIWRDVEAEIYRQIKKKGCPNCEGDNLELNVRCHMETRECFHVATCKNCGKVFVVEDSYPEGGKPPILDQ